MAFAITNTNPNQDPNFVGVPIASVQLADQTGTTASVPTAPNSRTFRAFVYVKSGTWGLWNGSSTGLSFELQASNDTAFSDGTTVTVDVKTLNNATIGEGFGGYMIELFGTYPLIGGASFMRLEVFNLATATIAFDAELSAA